MSTPTRTESFPAAAPARPRLRGWSHALGAALAGGATIALCLRSLDDGPRLISLLVYGLSLTAQYAASSSYHLGPWQGGRRALARALDHAGIFVVIAGTYTPVCVNVLAGELRPALLAFIWVLAAAGVGVSLAPIELPRWLRTGLYIAMGWGATIATTSVVQLLPPIAIATIVAGGVLNTIGAVIYARKRPDPFPAVFGFHELFHLLVLAGSAAFFVAIWIWVVPFPRA